MTVHSWIQQLLNRTLRSAAGKGGHRRPEQRRKRSAKVWLEALEDRLAPATLIVNSVGDNNTADSVLTLREAILLVNRAGDPITALGRSSLTLGETAQISGSYGSNDTIQFASSLNGTINLAGVLPDLSRSVRVLGPGATNLTVRRNTGGNYSIFAVDSGTTCTLSGLTIANGGALGGGGIRNQGTLTVSNDSVSGNFAVHGGGILNDGGVLTLSNSTLTGNSALLGGGIFNGGTLTLSNCALTGNHADNGGGIYSYGTMTVSNCTLAGNLASVSGGGILSVGGTMTVSNCTLAGNSAVYGGGISNGGGTVTVSNCTLASNSAINRGGGIYSESGTMTVSNCTLTGNSANTRGGGIAIYGGAPTVGNTIIAGNSDATDPDVSGSLASQGHNLIGNSSGGSGFVASDLQNVDPRLGPLQDNGGPTQTMAILPGSPALDAGDNTAAAATDQRGFSRMANGTVDIGAFEVQFYAVTNTNDSGIGSLRTAVGNANQAGGSIITFGVNGTINLAGVLPDISRSVQIFGPGANNLSVRRNTGGNYRIFTVDSGTTCALAGLTITNGNASNGGGILNQGTLTLSNDSVSGNSATGGGGIENDGTLTVSNSTLSRNSATEGGGILNNDGSLTLSNSTLAANRAAGNGGGIDNSGGLTVRNSTVASNSAGNGGGIYNSGGTLTARNTLVAGNTAATGPDFSGALSSQGHNLISNSSGGSGFVASDLLDVQALLGPLQNNGGPTQTMALLPGSPALDAGDNANAPATDQRGPGFPRIINGIIDIGAFEYAPPLITTVAAITRSTPAGQFTNASSISYLVSFATATLGLSANNFSLSGTAGAGTIGMPSTIDNGLDWSVPVTGLGSANGTLILNLVNDTGLDHHVTNMPFAGQAYTVDHVAPTVSIGAPSKTITNTGPVTYTITYMDANFKSSTLSTKVHLSATGTASGTLGFDNSSGATRTVTISSITGDGTLGISIDPGSGCDLAGNLTLAAGPSTTFTVDDTRPTVSMTSAAPNPTRSGSITVAVTISESVADFTASALVVGNGTVSNFSGSGASYTFTLTPTTLGTPTTVDLSANVFHDAAGNGNVAAAQFSRTFLAPIAVQSFQINPLDTTGQRSMVTTLQVTFNTLVTFDAAAFTLAGDNSVVLHVLDTTPVGGTKTVVTITFTGATIIGHSLADGRYSLAVHAGHIHAGADTMATDRVFSFFRFFGDLNGDGKVDATDQASFFGAMTGNPAYAQYRFACDYNGDGLVNRDDLTQFFQRFGKTLP